MFQIFFDALLFGTTFSTVQILGICLLVLLYTIQVVLFLNKKKVEHKSEMRQPDTRLT